MRNRAVVAITRRLPGGVLYQVKVGRMVYWSCFVFLGTDRAHRPGGSAFDDAEKEQDRQAAKYLGAV